MAFALNRRIRAGAAIVFCTTALFATHQVDAQTEPDAAITYHVINADDVYVRSGASQSYYPLGKVNRGQIVEVTGEKFNWARVRLDTPAFKTAFGYVKYPLTDRGRFDLAADGKAGRAMGSVRVYAPNLDLKNDVKGSWKWLVAVPAGTRLTVLDSFETETDRVHKVALPADAYGYVSLGFLDAATPDQVRTYQNSRAGIATIKPEVASKPETTPARASTGTKPAALPEATIATKTAAEAARSAAEATPVAKPVIKPVEVVTDVIPERETVIGPRPSEATTTTTAGASSSESMTTEVLTIGKGNDLDRPAVDTAEKGGTGTSKMEPVRRRVSRASEADTALKGLEAAFERLKQESLETAEVKPLRGLYLDLAGDFSDVSSVSAYAAARAEQLEIWADLQARKQELRDLRARVRSGNEVVEATRTAVEAAGRYDAVGRLQASTIYTGRTLPRLFRLQDPGSGRTLAYLRPDQSPQLAGMLGQLVGVRGDRNYDSGLRLNLIEHPRTLDLLTPQSVR